MAATCGNQIESMVWRDGRVAEGGGLLNRCTVKSRTGGSNPPLSAISSSPNLQGCIMLVDTARSWQGGQSSAPPEGKSPLTSAPEVPGGGYGGATEMMVAGAPAYGT